MSSLSSVILSYLGVKKLLCIKTDAWWILNVRLIHNEDLYFSNVTTKRKTVLL